MERFALSPLSRFNSWRTPEGRCPQGDFLKAMGLTDRTVFRSGNQIGKTRGGTVNANLLATGWHPWAKLSGVPWRELGRPTHGWVSSLSWDFCAEVLWPRFKQDLPLDEVRSITYRRRSAPEIPNQVVYKNGSTVTFKSAEQKRGKYQGSTLDWIWIDEEHPADIVEECRARLLHSGGLLIVTLTPVMRARWVSALEREEGTIVVRASMIEAARSGLMGANGVTKVMAYSKSLPERQRRVRVHGEYVALEGIVYPDFDRLTHCATIDRGQKLLRLGDKWWPWPLPRSWPRYQAIDWGFSNPTAILTAVGDPQHNRLIFTQCLYASDIRASVWAEHHKRTTPIRPRLRPLADHDSFARAEFEAKGVGTTPANKDVDTGIEAVARLLMPCGDGVPGLVLVIDETQNDPHLGRCDMEKLAWEFEGYHYKEKKEDKPDQKDEPVKKDDHALDAGRYLVKEWETSRGGPPRPPSAGREVKREGSPIMLAQESPNLLG